MDNGYFDTPGSHRIHAAMMRKYAQANRDTHRKSNGRRGSLYMAEMYDASATVAEQRAKDAEQRVVSY